MKTNISEIDQSEQLLRAIMLLDCALPHFERLADRERTNYAGHGLRPITHQERLKAVLEMINDVGPTVGYQP